MTKIQDSLLYKKIMQLTAISATSMDLLFKNIKLSTLTKGTKVLNEGQRCTKIYFVEKGSLRTFYNKDGNEINTNFTLDGYFTTNLKSLRHSTLSDVAIQANESTMVYEFDKEQMLNLYKQSAEIESFGRMLLEELLIAQEAHSNIFKIYSPQERYRYLQENNPELLQRISLSQLASYLGVARETLSRIRGRQIL